MPSRESSIFTAPYCPLKEARKSGVWPPSPGLFLANIVLAEYQFHHISVPIPCGPLKRRITLTVFSIDITTFNH